ncbi:XkdQ/YqbQ family protein [Anaerophilus nitritogenes]|uniref:XkdQ/YqbQ family protein n=1 Tax=Anaerophilus nitritogenes TaxID=2498136 RepID=UPI00101D0453|nr:hypothetical protein [Anaerophilus nitritogenes]
MIRPIKVLLLKSKIIDITPIVQSISLNSNVDTLGQELDINIISNFDTQCFPINPVEIDNHISILNHDNTEIFRGMVVADNTNDRNPKGYKCFDYAFNLNKSEDIFQFKDISVQQALQQICNRYNIKNNICSINTKVKKIYKDKITSDVIKDLLDIAKNETGKKFFFEVNGDTLYVKELQNEVIKATFKLANNVQDYDINNGIGSVSIKKSAEDLKNSIVIVKDNNILATVQDQNNINKFGLLQMAESIEENDKAKAQNKAKNLLNEFNKIVEETNVQFLGDFRVKCNRILELNEPVTGLSGQYRVMSCTHNYDNIHVMNLGLERVM